MLNVYSEGSKKWRVVHLNKVSKKNRDECAVTAVQSKPSICPEKQPTTVWRNATQG